MAGVELENDAIKCSLILATVGICEELSRFLRHLDQQTYRNFELIIVDQNPEIVRFVDGGHKQMGTDRSQTVTATDNLIARYKSKGYGFATIPQMQRDSVRAAL